MSLNPTDVNRQQSVHRWLDGQSPCSHMDDSATSHTDESLPSLESMPENPLPPPFHKDATLNNPLLTGAHDLEDVSFSEIESLQEQPSIPPSDATDAADVASNSSIASENQSLFQWAMSQLQDETDDKSLPWVQLYPHNPPTSPSQILPDLHLSRLRLDDEGRHKTYDRFIVGHNLTVTKPVNVVAKAFLIILIHSFMHSTKIFPLFPITDSLFYSY